MRVPSYLRKRSLALAVAALLALGLTAVSGVPAASAAPRTPSGTSLWPRFSTPRTVLAANATDLSGEDQLTATTLEGVYNAAQRPSRLYLIQKADDQFWLDQLSRRVHVVTIQPPSQDTLLQALLQRFRSVIKGAIVTNPSNPDTVDLATTMAGLDHAIVIAPDQESLIAALNIPVLYSFDTAAFTADTPVETYQWAVQNLLPQTSTRLVVVLPDTNDGDIRDYAVATGAFVFWLTTADADEVSLFNTIIEHTPVNTPVLGYVANENDDVADLSSLGHFLNGSDDVTNETVDYDPAMLEYYNSHLPRNSELEAGPSGIGYTSETSGADMTQFAELTRQIMARDGLDTVDTYEPPAELSQYSDGQYPVGVSKNAPLLYEQTGKTAIYGQTSGYLNTLESLFCTIHQQSTTEQAGGQPLFLEPLVDGFVYGVTDLLHIAQQLTLAGNAAGINFVFTTPTELELTMQRYYAGQEAGLPAANAQSMTGAQVLAEPSAGSPLPTGTVQVTGQNLVTNPSGASGTTGWTTSGGTVTATTYLGQPALQWTSDVTSAESWVHYYPAVTDGQTYTFSADVAGSGQVFMDVYDGSDETTLPVQLTSTYQQLTWTVTIPSNAATGQTGSAPQLQIRDSGAGPVSLYISDASVAASTAAC
jgi:hypothetical protein